MPDYRCNICNKTLELHKNHKGSLVHRVAMGAGKCNGTLQPVATAAPAPKSEAKSAVAKPKKDPFAPLPIIPKAKTAPVTPKTTVAPSKEDQRADTNSSVYVFDEKWSAAKCTKQATGRHGAPHAERDAYNHVKVTYATEWIGFKQNAAPCRGGWAPNEATLNTRYCDGYFASESNKRENGGFVFVITADHGDYLSGWREIYGVDKAGPEFPYNMYCAKGKWSFDPPTGAPDSTPG